MSSCDGLTLIFSQTAPDLFGFQDPFTLGFQMLSFCKVSSLLCLFCVRFLRQDFCVALAALEFTMWTKLTLNSRDSPTSDSEVLGLKPWATVVQPFSCFVHKYLFLLSS